MSEKVDITLDSFLSEVNKRNTNKDGSERDPRLLERFQNPICQDCHARYKEKYPGIPFKIKCNGVYDDPDYVIIREKWKETYPDEEPPDLETIKEITDPSYWARKHIYRKDHRGDLVPFVPRWYQEWILRCTAMQKVDRCGRGTGKTTVGVIEELHKAITRKNYDILVVSPADSQSEKWFTEILVQVENSPSLREALAQKKQQPYKIFRFNNGSTISIFTAGSASGRGADSIRSQSPRRVRCEEQDYLAEKDWGAIEPLLNRYSDSEFHGASTPTGSRNKFWNMCTKYPRYKEFYFPVTVLPDWSPEKEEQCILEAKTMDRYRHEYLAEFGDPTQGVFKGIFVDRAKGVYEDPQHPHTKGYDTCQYDPNLRYFMGVDWNGEGTGTRIRVLSYDTISRIRRCVTAHTVDEATWTVNKSIDAIQILNKKWHCEKVFIDRGYGQAQDEMIRMRGVTAPPTDADTRRLRDIIAIDFGAKLITNKLVPLRDPNSKYLPEDKNELERPTKPFMVEGAVMAIETGLVTFWQGDSLLDEQLRAYRVKNWSAHGYPSSYEVEGDCGDHDLDAFMLALLAIEMTYGMFKTPEELKKWTQIVYVGNFGANMGFGKSSSDPMNKKREDAGIPNRTQPTTTSPKDEYRLMYLMKSGSLIAPARSSSGRMQTGSRTSIFRKSPGNKDRNY